MERGESGERMHHRDGDWRYRPADETFIVETPMPSVSDAASDEPSFSGVRPNPFTDPEKIPANPVMVRSVEEARELRAELARDLTKYFAKIPDSLTMPAAHELARHTDQDIHQFEEMHRTLDDQLKEILVRYVPDVHFSTFAELMDDGFRGGTLSAQMQKTLREACGDMLNERLFFEVTNHLALFAAFAENIANARYIKHMSPEEG